MFGTCTTNVIIICAIINNKISANDIYFLRGITKFFNKLNYEG